MPTETLAVVAGILGVFAFFGAMLLYTDLTWDRPARQRAR